RTGVEDVDSYESERALTRLAVDTPIDALHEAHVGGDEVQLLVNVRAPLGARDGAGHVREPDDAVEIGDRRRLGVAGIAAAIRAWSVDVEPAAKRGAAAWYRQRIGAVMGFRKQRVRAKNPAAERGAGQGAARALDEGAPCHLGCSQDRAQRGDLPEVHGPS